MSITDRGQCTFEDALKDEGFITALYPAIVQNNVKEIMFYVSTRAKRYKTSLSVLGSALCAKMVTHYVYSRNSNADVLNIDERIFINNVIKICENFQSDKFINKHFIEIICAARTLPIELVWRLHSSGLLDIITYLSFSVTNSERSKNLIASLSQILCASLKEVPITNQILCDICSALITKSFGPLPQVNSPEIHNAKQMAGKILNNVTAKILDGILSSNLQSTTVTVLYEVVRKGGIVDKIALQKFCMQQLSFILTYCPTYKVSCAISKQNCWSFFKSPTLLVNIFIELLVPLSSKDVTLLLKQTLESHEVNWHMLLTFVSVFIIVCNDGVHEVTALINSFLNRAFETTENDAMIVSFLLARQAANEGSSIFPSYIDWFQGCFVSNSLLANSKKNFTFLMTFLSSIVPHEPVSCLKVHISKVFNIPSKCQSIYTDYKNLAKARLLDLEGDIYEFQRAAEENKQAKADVEEALSFFEKSGKIPSFVIETYIFRKPYFITRFLNALLKPKQLCNTPDTRMKFIEMLHITGKISPTMYAEYLSSCQQKSTVLMEIDPDEVASVTISVDNLKTILTDVVDLIDTFEVNNLKVTMDSLDKIATALQKMSKHKYSNYLADEIIDISSSHNLNLELIKVVDLILITFCKIHIALLHCVSALSSQFALHYMVMITSYPVLHKPLAIRLWNLLTGKDHLKLEPGHISGLGHFLFHLHSSVHAFPAIIVKTKSHQSSQQCHKIKGSIVQCLSDHLSVLGENEMCFSLRFLTSYLCAAVFCNNIDTSSVPSSLLNKFLSLSEQLEPEFQEDASLNFNYLDVKALRSCAEIKKLL